MTATIVWLLVFWTGAPRADLTFYPNTFATEATCLATRDAISTNLIDYSSAQCIQFTEYH